MKKRLCAMLTYVDKELKIQLYSIYDDIPYLMFTSDAIKVDVSKIHSDIEKERITIKLQEILEKIKRKFNFEIKNINACIDAEEYVSSKKVYSFEFENVHRITRADIKKVYNQALLNDDTHTGFVLIDFSIKNFVLDERHQVYNPIGNDVEKFQVVGEQIKIDSKTYYGITSLMDALGITIEYVVNSTFMLKKYVQLDEGELLIDIGTNKINFIVNSDDDVKQFSNEVGYKKFIEELYKSLVDKFDKEQAEKATRFAAQYFVLKPYELNINITDEITVNDIVTKLNTIIMKYFEHIYNQLIKQNIKINKINILTSKYEPDELVESLAECIGIDVLEYNTDISNVEQVENYKSRFAIYEINERTKTMESE